MSPRRSKKLKVLILCHSDLVPPEAVVSRKLSYRAPWKTEYDVARALRQLGYQVQFCGVRDSLGELRDLLASGSVDLVFNLLEEFAGQAIFEPLIVSLLEDYKVPFTGCSFTPLLLCRHKVSAKWILRHQKVLTPNFTVFKDLRKTRLALRRVFFPAIVKPANEDASLGISPSSYVENYQQARLAAKKLREVYKGNILVERFIEGREFHVAGIREGSKTNVFRPVETVFGSSAKKKDTIATERIKWDLDHRRKRKIVLRPIDPSEATLDRQLRAVTRRTFKALGLDGYARIDVRVDRRGRVFVIDVNPNPDVGQGFEMAENLRSSGFGYVQMIQMILRQVRFERR